MRNSIEADKRAKDLRGRAAAVGKGGISADDPDAVLKLKEKLQAAETKQAFMKAANRVIRAAHKAGIARQGHDGFSGYLDKLQAIPGGEKCTAKTAIGLATPYLGSIGFPAYSLTNNNANIRRMKNRIEQLQAASAAETMRQTFQGVCKLVENVDENRLQFLFEGKPNADIRSALKAQGFRWAPSQEAWQRQLTNAARYSAKQVLNALGIAS